VTVVDEDQLVPLKDLGDYRVAPGSPDIRGWDVYGSDGQKIGTVRDLIVDARALKARYLMVGLKHSLFSRERHVVVPIGRASLDHRGHYVLLEDANVGNAERLRAYDEATFRREERHHSGGDYNRPEYDESRFWNRPADVPKVERPAGAGEVPPPNVQRVYGDAGHDIGATTTPTSPDVDDVSSRQASGDVQSKEPV
jgi:sporulation protein YlmC with PRC-barrel domain